MISLIIILHAAWTVTTIRAALIPISASIALIAPSYILRGKTVLPPTSRTGTIARIIFGSSSQGRVATRVCEANSIDPTLLIHISPFLSPVVILIVFLEVIVVFVHVGCSFVCCRRFELNGYYRLSVAP
jgi:hypothetical protein